MSGTRHGRRRFLKTAGLAALGGMACRLPLACTRSNLSGSKPNIIFIFADDISYRDLSAFGQRQFQTPNLDRLALGGVRFTQAYAGACECAPSRASLMTGMHMGHCRIRANRSVRGQDHLLSEDFTVAEMLKESGYTTGFIGKWGIGLPGTEGVPHKQGFDFAYGFYDQLRAHGFFPDYIMENGRRIVLPQNHGFNMERVYRYNRRPVDNLDDVANGYDASGRLIPDGVADPRKASHSEELFQKAALDFIEKNRDNRFFLYYATQLPHGPCITPDLGEFRENPWSLKHKEWAAMVSHLDRGVGDMVALLKKLGLEKDTVIFFAGDNGYSQWGYFGRKAWADDPLFRNKGPWRAGKFVSQEGGLRVPLFVSWSGRIAPRESAHVCALYDFLPTAAELAGATRKHATDGISLVPALEDRPDCQEKHEYLYWENGTKSPHAQAVRMGPWYAYRSHPNKPTALYHIDTDVGCSHDVADQHPEIVGRVERVFQEAHEDSQWYINPGESRARTDEKREEARRTNALQTPTRPNSLFRSGALRAKSAP